MPKYVIIGGGGHARMIINTLMARKEIIGYIDIKDNREMDSVQYLGDDTVALSLLGSDSEIVPVFGIGLIKNAKVRESIINKYSYYHGRFIPVISSSAEIADSVKIGVGTVVGVHATINNGTEVGPFCIINTGAIVEHDVRLEDNVHLAPGSTICGEVQIARNVFVGAGSVISNRVKISNDVIIGAGSVVTSNIDAPGVYVGIPARKVVK